MSRKIFTLCSAPEITLVRDLKGRDTADDFTTLCDKFGLSGDYHEFIYGPASDKEGESTYHAQRRLWRRASGEGPLSWLLYEDHAERRNDSLGLTACAARMA